jgi:hypothetical protein
MVDVVDEGKNNCVVATHGIWKIENGSYSQWLRWNTNNWLNLNDSWFYSLFVS